MSTKIANPLIVVLQKTFDNDRIDGNSTSIVGGTKGPYVTTYTSQMRQTLRFEAYHDDHQYSSLSAQTHLYDVKYTPTTDSVTPAGNSYYISKLPAIHIGVEAGETIYIGLKINYEYFLCCGILTRPAWVVFKLNSAGLPYDVTGLDYVIPNAGQAISYYRSVALKGSPWVYQ